MAIIIPAAGVLNRNGINRTPKTAEFVSQPTRFSKWNTFLKKKAGAKPNNTAMKANSKTLSAFEYQVDP